MAMPGYQEEPATYCRVLEVLISEIADTFPSVHPRDLHRDLLTVQRRTNGEGFGFLSLVLPRLSDALVTGLESGTFAISPDFGFPMSKGRNTPAFLPYLFTRVFHADGTLRSDACPGAIAGIRQICSFFSKLERPVGSWCDSHIESFHDRVSATPSIPLENEVVLIHARAILSEVFDDFDPHDIIGRHGPGAVADSLKNDEKWDHSQFSRSVGYWYPREEYYALPSTVRKRTPDLSPDSYPARLIVVPKTAKAPRIIAAEPSGHAFLQGGLNEAIMRKCERHWLTRGHVNFVNQGVNQALAREGSLSPSWATIDLSDASDLMRASFVRAIFPTKIGTALDVLRTQEVLDAGNTRTTALTTFATMGNGLTFTVMSVALHSLLVGALLWDMGSGPRCSHPMDESCSVRCYPASHLRIATRSVYVYGDDIIVPVDKYDLVCSVLERYGFKPNRRKSFVRGSFRESCGTDWYKGVETRPVYARAYLRWTRNEPSRLTSTVALSNLLEGNGLRKTAEAILGPLKGKLPYGPQTASYLCIHRDWTSVQYSSANSRRGFRTRLCRDSHTLETKVWFNKPRMRPHRGSEEGRLLSALTRRENVQAPLVVDGTRPSLIKFGWRRSII